MAEQVPSSPSSEEGYRKGLGKLTEELTCPVCHEIFQEPKILPCLHFYCTKCLIELTTKFSPGLPFSCPECRAETILTSDEVQTLPTAFFVNRLKTVYFTMSKAHGRTDVICELCTTSGVLATAFCRQCTLFICEFCKQAHTRFKPYRGHSIVRMDELLQSTKRHQLPMATIEPNMCEEHDQEIKLLCLDCDQLICRDCTVIDHREHEYNFIKTIAPGVKKRFEEEFDLLSEEQVSVCSMKENIVKSKINIVTEAKILSNFVNEALDDLIQLYEQCRQDLLAEIQTESSQKLSKLSSQDKQLTLVTSEVQGTVDFLRRTLKNGTDEDIVSVQKQVQNRVHREHRMFSETANLVEDLETMSIHQSTCAARIAHVASSCILADPEKCYVQVEPTYVGKKSKILIHTLTNAAQPCYSQQMLDTEITFVPNFKRCTAMVTKNISGVYEMSFMPFSRGQHTVSVSVNNVPISGSPFSFVVKPTLSQMKAPFRTITTVPQLTDITMTRDGSRLLATQTHTGSIISFDKEGSDIAVEVTDLGHPMGIVTSETGDIYITDRHSHCLRKFNSTFTLVSLTGCLGGALGSFNKPAGLAVNQRGEVMVCDKKNSRIQIFDENLRFKRWYSTAKPVGVACCMKKNIFVTDTNKNRVCKISDQTIGLREFCKDLKEPRGIYVNEDHVYITEGGCGQISVYNHSGRYAGSLGDGVLKNPGGITGDKDGYLYVCDEGTNSVYVF